MFAGLNALGTALGGGVQAAGASVDKGLTKVAVGVVVGSTIHGWACALWGAGAALVRGSSFGGAPFWRRGGARTEQAAAGDALGASQMRPRAHAHAAVLQRAHDGA